MDRGFASPWAVLQWTKRSNKISHPTVGNILKRHDIPPAPKRKQSTSWDFIRAHMAVMVGTDFFTAEVLTLKGLKTYYVLFFIHLESRRICWAGVTRHPDQEWMEQIARNVTMEETGILANCRYLLHDRDTVSPVDRGGKSAGVSIRQ